MRTCPFVLSNQWALWSLYGPNSVFSGLIYWSCVCQGPRTLLISHAATEMVCVWAVERHLEKISGVSCQLKSSKREAFMPQKDEHPLTIKVKFPKWGSESFDLPLRCSTILLDYIFFQRKKNVIVSFLSPSECEEKPDSLFISWATQSKFPFFSLLWAKIMQLERPQAYVCMTVWFHQ